MIVLDWGNVRALYRSRGRIGAGSSRTSAPRALDLYLNRIVLYSNRIVLYLNWKEVKEKRTKVY